MPSLLWWHGSTRKRRTAKARPQTPSVRTALGVWGHNTHLDHKEVSDVCVEKTELEGDRLRVPRYHRGHPSAFSFLLRYNSD